MDTERKKLNILVAIDEVPDPVWEQFAHVSQISFVREGRDAYRALTAQRFDVVFLDLHLANMDSLELLRRIRTEKLCGAVVLTSAVPSFSYAQQGILYGVSAYLLRPLQAAEMEDVLYKLQSSTDTDRQLQAAALKAVDRLRDGDAADIFLQAGKGLIHADGRAVEDSIRWRDLYETLTNLVYHRYPWLSLYHHPTEFASLDFVQESDSEMVVNFCLRKVQLLSGALQELFPKTRNQKMEELLIFLLQSIDENVQQKEIAERCFITNSSLSTRFRRNLGLSYREYMTTLKLCRGQYLLRYTDIPAEELAAHLGYKDREHFARLFLQRTGQTLQECGRRNWGEYMI